MLSLCFIIVSDNVTFTVRLVLKSMNNSVSNCARNKQLEYYKTRR